MTNILYIDTKTNKIERLLDSTSNSFLVTQTKLSDKGITSSNWFTQKDFETRFKLKQ